MQREDTIFNELVRENHGRIYRICKVYLYDKSHTNDLYQEILLQLWKSMDRYRGTAQISTWVYRIAVNTAISYNARYKKDKFQELNETVDIHDTNSGTNEKEQQLSDLFNAIKLLEEHDRILISLVLEDLSYKEIAEITGSNANNIGVRISRIKERLFKLMNNKTS